MEKRYICIHGHFYQPPRENPWLEAVELQDSAYPYHDWNHRVTSQCYASNGRSRILDDDGRISRIVNNYSKISFNFGPTLLSWLEKNAEDVYEAILEGDRESRKRFSGHGSALAQVYNHMILPLANRRDKVTQVRWGIRDFEHRFERKPEGMWLSEAAVDLETLEILAEHDIRFTILAPGQAKRIRPIDSEEWEDVGEGTIDPTRAYVQHLPSGQDIALFFYDGPISQAVAFEGLLGGGEVFAERLLTGFSTERSWPQLVHIATDGESYGHHHPHGDMALAYALHHIEEKRIAVLTNYGEYLEKHPPDHEVEIFEESSWSCVHGIERWRSDCGCSSGGHPGWNQVWRKPLREALDWLRDSLAPLYEKKAYAFFESPSEARNDYIEILLDRSPDNVERFFSRHAGRKLDNAEAASALKLLELQRNAMLMYTSCGWFFDEVSGIETVQILQYAGRALQLARDLFEEVLEPRFLEILEQAKSNIAQHVDGRRVYAKFVKPAVVDLEKVGGHYAMSSLFEEYPDRTDLFCYTADREVHRYAMTGKASLIMGRVNITSEITRESRRLCFGMLHWGDHNIGGCVRACEDEEPNPTVTEEIFDSFGRAEFPETYRLLEKYFGTPEYSLPSLFKDEQRRILDIILESTLSDAEALYRQIYETNAPLLRFLNNHGIPTPKVLYTSAEVVVNASLRDAFETEELDLDRIGELLEVVDLEGVPLDHISFEMAIRQRMEHMAEQFSRDPEDIATLRMLEAVSELIDVLPFEVNLRNVQNMCYRILEDVYPKVAEEAHRDEESREWTELFVSLGGNLRMRVDAHH